MRERESACTCGCMWQWTDKRTKQCQAHRTGREWESFTTQGHPPGARIRPIRGSQVHAAVLLPLPHTCHRQSECFRRALHRLEPCRQGRTPLGTTSGKSPDPLTPTAFATSSSRSWNLKSTKPSHEYGAVVCDYNLNPLVAQISAIPCRRQFASAFNRSSGLPRVLCCPENL